MFQTFVIDNVSAHFQINSGVAHDQSVPDGFKAASSANARSANASTLARAIDILVAVAALILFAPLMIAIGIAIRVTSGGPAVFRQTRLGMDGREFTCLKFRTMHQNSDALLSALLLDCARSRSEWERDRKLRNDPRIIRLGRSLRRTSLDELPQIFNVLRGDMSIVGPRPIVRAEAARYGRYITSYYQVRPGITGLWQVSGRNATTYRRRVACDVAYARSSCAKTNVAIMFRTVPVVLGARGAY